MASVDMAQKPADFKVISYYLKMMLLRFSRHIRAFGLSPWVIWIGMPLCFVLLHQFLYVREPEFAPFIWTAIALVAILQLNGRDHISFLRQFLAPGAFKTIRLAESILVALPFVALSLLKGQIILAGAVVVVGVGASLAPITLNLQMTIPSPFSKYPFEFTTGFRRWVLLILMAYILGLVALTVDNFNLALFSLLSLGLIALGFYSGTEPIHYLWIHRFSASAFLWFKMRVAVRDFSLLAIPVIVILLSMDLTQWWLVLLTLMICLLLLLMCLLGKYAYYPAVIPIVPGLAIGFCVLFPPLVLVILPFFYRRAQQNCSKILT